MRIDLRGAGGGTINPTGLSSCGCVGYGEGYGEGSACEMEVVLGVLAAYPRSEALYLDLHQHPELSFHEMATEGTGLPYASTVRTKDDAGVEVGVMHACGHDIHMAALMGADGLFTRFPRPDFALAVHDDARARLLSLAHLARNR